MHRIKLVIAFLFASAASFAQDSVRLSGAIKNKANDSILITYNTNRIAYYPQSYTAHTDKNGHFSISFPLPKDVYVETAIQCGSSAAETILRAGDSLYLTADATRFDSSVHFAGRGSAIQNMLAKHALQSGKMQVYAVQVKEAINKGPNDFLKEIAALLRTEQDFLEKNKAGLPASFIKYWNAWHQYYNYFIMQQYPRMREVVKLRRFTDTIPEENYIVIKDMPLAFDDSLLQVPSYLMYLTGAIDIKLRAGGFGYLQNDEAKMRMLEDSTYKLVYKLMPAGSAAFFTAQDIYGHVRHQALHVTRDQLAAFRRRWPQSEYTAMIAAELATMERLAPGQPAPDFAINTPDGTHKMLSDLKGKVVYLTFWASWSKQCVSEMVNFQKRKELLKKQPVEFVYVSIDKYPADAEALVRKYNVSGLFTYVPGEWYAREIQLYGVQALPAYFMIDKKGRFAPQPAIPPTEATELILQIGRLLK